MLQMQLTVFWLNIKHYQSVVTWNGNRCAAEPCVILARFTFVDTSLNIFPQYGIYTVATVAYAYKRDICIFHLYQS